MKEHTRIRNMMSIADKYVRYEVSPEAFLVTASYNYENQLLSYTFRHRSACEYTIFLHYIDDTNISVETGRGVVLSVWSPNGRSFFASSARGDAVRQIEMDERAHKCRLMAI